MKTPVKAGVRVAELPVFLGAAPTVGLVAGRTTSTLLMPVGAGDGMSGRDQLDLPGRGAARRAARNWRSMVITAAGMDDIDGAALRRERGGEARASCPVPAWRRHGCWNRWWASGSEPAPAALPLPAQDPVVPGSRAHQLTRWPACSSPSKASTARASPPRRGCWPSAWAEGHATRCSPANPAARPGAEEIRRLVLEGDPERWSAETEILLFTAARRDHLERVIDPALAAGRGGGLRPLRRFHPDVSGPARAGPARRSSTSCTR